MLPQCPLKVGARHEVALTPLGREDLQLGGACGGARVAGPHAKARAETGAWTQHRDRAARLRRVGLVDSEQFLWRVAAPVAAAYGEADRNEVVEEFDSAAESRAEVSLLQRPARGAHALGETGRPAVVHRATDGEHAGGNASDGSGRLAMKLRKRFAEMHKARRAIACMVSFRR